MSGIISSEHKDWGKNTLRFTVSDPMFLFLICARERKGGHLGNSSFEMIQKNKLFQICPVVF